WLENGGAVPTVFSDPRHVPAGSLDGCLATIDRRWVRLASARSELAAAQAEAGVFASAESRDELRWVYEAWQAVLNSLEAMAAAPGAADCDGAAEERSSE
ncbi:MAG: hypothetical protein NTZ05_02760, partial [Chloroflexi bacterium]|nr:hypothetical protein [Chloroflexota bacterium]